MTLHLFALGLSALAVPLFYGQHPIRKISPKVQRLLALACIVASAILWGMNVGWEWGIPFLCCALMISGFCWVLVSRRWQNFSAAYQWLSLALAALGSAAWLGGV
ncbi:hypothetical protein [Pseudoteredinibacter isoporae]|uniref:Putative Mn2+ efflux pump MntP n=1 Tax=Pseudoteredinibacter isoporae TaxID=570281 RepID=A0A7X0JSN3_9GAMM|nr:hypothetical protein [Pseudoteredinibacter isoporae]MBB6520581.1 putative Mn2+ efflux pump MntP [Pseudoteredinibacter isoporae]NHO86148.1 hypothetical protein [Pseudoteredinibacter isoporae]NIB25401.1 hypothetical protein [Pseudoteredinibacter isoporae]